MSDSIHEHEHATHAEEPLRAVQTFLPYPSFALSARCLNRKHLVKQRIEAKQILSVLTGLSRGWPHHPATRMWAGYEGALAYYGWVACAEWLRQERNDEVNLVSWFSDRVPEEEYPLPPWLGNEHLHRSHRSNLVRKMPDFYGPLWDEDYRPGEPYLWPLREENDAGWSFFLSEASRKRGEFATLRENMHYDAATRRVTVLE